MPSIWRPAEVPYLILIFLGGGGWIANQLDIFGQF